MTGRRLRGGAGMTVSLVDAVCAYARRLHASIGDEHHIASPLGAWLLLALAASADTGADRADLDAALGCSGERAAALARTQLAAPHEVLRLAAAVWPYGVTPDLGRWLAALPREVEIGAMPSQADADAWAASKTGGLIESFPLAIEPDTLLVLASALACMVTWQLPFDAVPAADLRLPRAAGFDALREVLRAPGADAGCRIVESDIGLLGVHAAASEHEDLLVVSVIGEPSVAAADVIAAAHPIAVALASGADLPGARSLFDLPSGSGAAWTITEHTGPAGHRGDQQYEALLPAWSATSEHDLNGPDLGFGAAMTVLAPLLGATTLPATATQTAMARYTLTGFEAAAVTAFGMAASAMVAREHLIRTAQLEFVHPYAVVAVTTGDGPWNGVPVFSGWIANPDEPSD